MMAGGEMTFVTGSPLEQENSAQVEIGGSENFCLISNLSPHAVHTYS